MKKPRGSPGLELGAENLARVREWFSKNLGGTQTECAEALELSVMAVNRHVKTLRAEWRNREKESR